MPDPTATATIDIAAAPERIYAIITNLDTFAEVASETDTMTWKRGTSAAPGSRFAGVNSNGKRRWKTTCRITDADGRRFGFEVTAAAGIPVSRWQYDLVASGDGGCTVTESTWDRRAGWFKRVSEVVTASPQRADINLRNIKATLDRLKARAEQG